MTSNLDNIKSWLKAYKKKYYRNMLLKGTILYVALLLSIFLVLNSLEFTFRLSSPFRATFLVLFLFSLLVVGWKWVVKPIARLFHLQKQISHEEAALQIGNYFPEISDKLLNTIQLQNSSASDNALIRASIQQREKDLAVFSFTDAVDFTKNKRYVKYLLPPLVISIALLMFIPQLFTEGTERIVNFNKEYIPEAPFSFELQNTDLTAFKNEDFALELSFSGNLMPNEAYIVLAGRKIKLKKEGESFSHTFQNVQDDIEFSFEAAGFRSAPYEVSVLTRPNLKGFNIDLQYPAYLRKDRERIENSGNMVVPEGTVVQWQFSSIEADSLFIYFENEGKQYRAANSKSQLFTLEKQVLNSDQYEVVLSNEHSKNKSEIIYTIEVIKDEFPEINLEAFQDTTLYNYLVLGGNVSDDYGLSQLKVFYKVQKDRNSTHPYKSFTIPLQKGQVSQSFYFPWKTDSIALKAGDQINYFLQVWDNDGVNGSKSTKTAVYTFKVPTTEEINDQLEKSSSDVKEKLTQSQSEVKDLKESLEEMENSLKGKKNLEWQDKQKLEEILRKKEELDKTLEELRKQSQQNRQQNERFGEQNEKIQEKAEQIQKLMDELLDEETKQLYEELRKLLEEQRDANSIQEQVQKINNKENNLEKELERTLELFKRMQFDHKLEKIIEKTEELEKKQEALSEKTEKGGKEEQSTKDALEQQKALNEEFEKIKEEIDDLQRKNQELKNPNSMQNTEKEEKEVDDAQQKSTEQLENYKQKNASKNQQKAAQEMKKLGQKMEQMQSGMEMSMMQENLDHLRDIVDNLVKLSFDQESVLTDFRKVNQTDPRFVKLSQEQLKLKDDAKIIQDSLLSLASRVFQIQSFVTREVNEMNEYMDGSLEALRERNQPKATSEQQFAMTSMNNLALLLDDVLKQMQQQMADAMGKPQKGKGGSKSMGMSELQQQLNERISELKKSGKSGRALSEELARLAAEQEKIRQALQKELQKASQNDGKGGGGNSKAILEKMEETEADLVNKQLSEETIRRQKEILTRLLEAENAMQEREQEERREAEQAKSYEQIIPSAFEDYIKAKEKEIELLKSVPPRLNPYYMQEVSEYFKRLKTP